MARIVYRMLKFGTDYVDQGEAYYEERYRERAHRHLAHRELGFTLAPIVAASEQLQSA